MSKRQTSDRGSVNLEVTANLVDVGGAERAPKTAAYAFSSGGRLLARASVEANKSVSLTFAAVAEPRSIRVLVGPDSDEEEPRLASLMRRGAIEHHVRIDPDALKPQLTIDVFPDDWLCWLLSRCVAKGTVLRRIDRDGVTVDLPVCGATVEVYEVDPIHIIIHKLPDELIEQIRGVIVNPPIPEPDPPPIIFPPLPPPSGPFPPPGPGPDPSPMFFPRAVAKRSGAAAIGPAEHTHLRSSSATLTSNQELRDIARSASVAELKTTLMGFPDITRHLLCMLFPHIVTKDLVATATTDDCGHFRAVFFRGCNNPDTPDLYFKVVRRIGPFTIPLYAPAPVACYTHWNYECGTEVTLYTQSPFAPTCSPCQPVDAPNNWVLVMAVGNLSLQRIRGTSVDLEPTTTSANLGLTDWGAPFGGLLRFRVEFDHALREDLGVRYYRMSFRRAGTPDDFTPITGSVVRHYTKEVGMDLILQVYPLGPQDVGAEHHLFEIPPALPPEGQWSFPDAVEDLTSAKFNTTALGAAASTDGNYEVKLDLFDSSGAPIDIATLNINYRVPAVADLAGNIDTDDAAVLGLVDGNSFVMQVHVDNNPCFGELATPLLNGTPADPACGVLTYDPANPGTVGLSFEASHPNRFANYSLTLVRGETSITGLLTPAGIVAGTAGPSGSSFSASASASTLLGGCTVAGFAEHLYVAAMATDGWSRQQHLDDSDLEAFVLNEQD